MILQKVHANRSIEDHTATLSNADGKILLTFIVRAHGKDARNQFTTDGSTPTGLFGKCATNPHHNLILSGVF